MASCFLVHNAHRLEHSSFSEYILCFISSGPPSTSVKWYITQMVLCITQAFKRDIKGEIKGNDDLCNRGEPEMLQSTWPGRQGKQELHLGKIQSGTLTLSHGQTGHVLKHNFSRVTNLDSAFWEHSGNGHTPVCPLEGLERVQTPCGRSVSISSSPSSSMKLSAMATISFLLPLDDQV